MIGSLPLSAPQLEARIVPALQAIEDRLMEVVTRADETNYEIGRASCRERV